MEITINIKNGQVKISLVDAARVVDEIVFQEAHNLSSVLLLQIDELLKRNKKEAKDIQNVFVNSDRSDSFTSTRIAKSVSSAFEWGIKNI